MLSAHYGSFAKGDLFRRLRERLLSGVKTAQKKVTGKVISFKQALVAAEGADKARAAQIRGVDAGLWPDLGEVPTLSPD